MSSETITTPAIDWSDVNSRRGRGRGGEGRAEQSAYRDGEVRQSNYLYARHASDFTITDKR